MSTRPVIAKAIFLGCLVCTAAIAVSADENLPWAFKGRAADGYSIDMVSIDPLPGTRLIEGASVKFRIDVSYRISIAPHGTICLVFQDEDDARVASKEPQACVGAPAPEGAASLEQNVTVPAHAKELRLFVPIMPDGIRKTFGELTIRYPIAHPQN